MKFQTICDRLIKSAQRIQPPDTCFFSIYGFQELMADAGYKQIPAIDHEFHSVINWLYNEKKLFFRMVNTGGEPMFAFRRHTIEGVGEQQIQLGLYSASHNEYIMNERLMEDYFNDMLDDCYQDVTIAGLSYSASVAFKRIDPIAYQCGMNDYESSLRTEYENDGESYKELFGDEEE